MIKKISISNYRSCLDTTFDINPNLSVLIGPNSSGKTNILNALLLLRKLVEERAYPSFDEERPTVQCTLKLWFDLDGKTVILDTTIDLYTDEENSDVVVSSQHSWYLKDFTGNGKRIQIPLWYARYYIEEERFQEESRFYIRQRQLLKLRHSFKVPGAAIKPLADIAQNLSQMRYYSASQFTNPANCPVSFEIEKEGKISRGIRLRGYTKFLFDLYNASKSSEQLAYQQFFDIIGPNGIQLIDELAFKEIPTSSIDYSVRSGGLVHERRREKILIIPQFRIGKNELSPNQLSEGTFRTITLLFYLITEESKILLVEEPEVFVHHGLLSSILELIKTYSRDKQIIISTHSDFVLDEVQPENVYRVSNSVTDGTKVFHIPKSMSNGELRALHDYLETEGNLGEYWRHGGLE